MRWLLVPLGYCLGSISFSLLLVRRLRQLDLRETGSGNPGATNVLRSAGGWPALAVLVLDVAKGAVPILIGERLGASGAILGCTAAATVLGHMYPIFHGFRGGKGVATSAGALGAAAPTILLACGLVFAVTLALTRYVSLASILGVGLYPVLAAWLLSVGTLGTGERWIPLTSAGVALLVLWRHRANVGRLLRHTEARLGVSKGSE
jgi:glycerol-3-phosphate acyltransferase PlsY